MKRVCALGLVLMAAGCAGELDTSSQGGGGTRVGAAPAAAEGVTYTGTITATMSADGYESITESAPLTIVISGNDVYLSAEGVTVQTTLSGNNFSLTFPVSGSHDGTACSGYAAVSGVRDGDSISGVVAGSGTCSEQSAGDVPVAVNGTISASVS